MVDNRLPKTWSEALKIRADEEVIPYFGGTDLMVRGNRTPKYLFLNQVAEIKDYEISDEVRIGAGVTYSMILENEYTPNLLKLIVEEVASPALRNMASVIGNVCNASPVGDTLPLFYAFDAVLELESVEGSREIPITDFIVDARKTSLKSNELVRAIRFKNLKYNNEYYQKVGPRSACSISKVDFVGIANTENGIVKDIRMAIGAVKNVIVRDVEFEKTLIGLDISELKSKTREIMDFYNGIITPIDDKRSTEKYRRQVVLNLIEDFISTIE